MLGFSPPSLREVMSALNDAARIKVPEGDFEGDTFNQIVHILSTDDQAVVEHAHSLAYSYTRTSDGEPNNRSLSALRRHGFDVFLNPSQYDPLTLYGRVSVGEHSIDIGDTPPDEV